MEKHPIEDLMKTAMENIKDMIDVNTIVGDPVETPDGSVIMPISKVGFGFAAGGSEFTTKETMRNLQEHNMPFGGGSGGGVSIMPIAFLVVGPSGVKVVQLDQQTHMFERLIDTVPKMMDQIQGMMNNSQNTTHH